MTYRKGKKLYAVYDMIKKQLGNPGRWGANKTKDRSEDCPKRYKDVLISDQGRCSHFSSFFLVKPGIK